MGLPKSSGLDLHSKWPAGRLNKITDVPGVRVANVTVQDKDINTGVTAILPCAGNMFRNKLMAGCSVINGFGKSVGLMQIQELGQLETPIIMTNTLSVGTATTALTKYMLGQNPDIGVDTGTVNCVVTECNDGRLNDIRGLHITEEHVFEALDKAEKSGTDFEEGSVGGGTGMCCLGFKGGIGSSSRTVKLDGSDYTIGAVVMSNFGSAGNLVIGGRHIGVEIEEERRRRLASEMKRDRGSIIMIIGTDIPMTSRQLGRVSRRAAISLGRTGSYMANGSGDIALAFTTANKLPHYSDRKILELSMIYEDATDDVFEASIEAVEESIVSALYHAETVRGVRNSVYYGMREFL